MKKIVSVVLLATIVSGNLFSQVGATKLQTQAQLKADGFTVQKNNSSTPVKNQARTGTCWSFSTSSLIESQYIKNTSKSDIDLSEMFTVYNMYIEKARNYILRQGKAQFSEGGLGHDVIRSIATYGAMPESAFSGLREGEQTYNHSKMIPVLKDYLDGLLKTIPLKQGWLEEYKGLLDQAMGKPPADFEYNGKRYTPNTFASEVLKFNSKDYVNITSFTHHPFFAPFIIEVPDNFSNGSYYNIPLADMIQMVKTAINKGYTVLWDADISNGGFMNNNGLGLFVKNEDQERNVQVSADDKELEWNSILRQQYYENLTTQDDHLMHITGIEKSKGGKEFFIVKNSWGIAGPYRGFMNVSVAYFAMNTISLVVPKQSIDPALLLKLGIK